MDAKLFEKELVGLYPYLQKLAMKLARDANKVDDLVQDTIIKVLSYKDKLVIEGSLALTLKKLSSVIIRNEFYNGTRLKINAPHEHIEDLNESEYNIQASQELQYDYKIIKERILNSPKEIRDVVYNIAILGLTYEETSEKLNIEIGTLKSRLSRFRDDLEYKTSHVDDLIIYDVKRIRILGVDKTIRQIAEILQVKRSEIIQVAYDNKISVYKEPEVKELQNDNA